jgi:hypothetical protein
LLAQCIALPHNLPLHQNLLKLLRIPAFEILRQLLHLRLFSAEVALHLFYELLQPLHAAPEPVPLLLQSQILQLQLLQLLLQLQNGLLRRVVWVLLVVMWHTWHTLLLLLLLLLLILRLS